MTKPINIQCKKCRCWMRRELAIEIEHEVYVCKECLDKEPTTLEENKAE